MPSPLPRREIYRKLRRLGFDGPFSGGKHQFMRRGKLKVWIPNPHGQDVSVGLIVRLLRQADISEGDWDSA